MAENKQIFPLWLTYPKAACWFWAGVGVYMGIVDPVIRKELPDTRSKLAWWDKLYRRGRATLIAVGISSVLVSLYAYNETKNKFFLYGSVVALLSDPYVYFVMRPHQKYLH